MTDNHLSKSAADLIFLVSHAVNGKMPDKRICEKMDLSDVLKIAQCHSLTVAAAFALEQVTTLPEDFREEKFKAIRRLSLMNVERERIFEKLEENEIGYLPLKGIVLKDCYPKTAMREMSDNDILCDENRMADVRELMEGLGFECKSFGKNHHDVYSKTRQIVFEMHRSLFDISDDPVSYDYFEMLKKRSVRDDDGSFCRRFSAEDMYIYLIGHLHLHYRTKGTGLRSLLDIYLYNKKYVGRLDTEYVASGLKKLGLDKFEQGIRELAEKTFTGRELSENEYRELGFFIDSNTHGTMDNLMMRGLENDDSFSAKSRYALKRLFPPKESLKRSHPFVYSHMAVYPFWIMYRPFKGAVKYPKKMLGEIKRLKRFRKKDTSGEY